MSVKDTARKQYVQIINRTAQQLDNLKQPSEGWLSALRKALGMSGAEVAARAGVTRAAIFQAERNERNGAITIKQMQKLADTMGGRFVYAIVPQGARVEDIIRDQARKKAEARIKRASAHMALELQSLTKKQTKQRIEDLASQLTRDMPPDFWEVK
ncbi:MAG: mobile mystery protein A [Pseudomonadota bacterium]